MATNPISTMSTEELRATLNGVADAYQIGAFARDSATILTNARNSARHAFCIKPPSEAVKARARLLPQDDPLRQYIMDSCFASIEEEDET